MFSISKSEILIFVLTMILVFLIFDSSLGTQFKGVENYLFPDTAIIQDDLVITGGNIRLDGIIEGDLISACRSLVQNGLILGSLNSVSQDLDVLGEVKGSVRGFAQNLNVNGKLDRNLIAFAYMVDVKPGAEIAKDVAAYCGKLNLHGKVGGSLKGSMGELTISGVVSKDVSVEVERITLMPTARILGDFKYKSKRAAKIESGAQISGETVWTEIDAEKEKKAKSIFTGESLISELLFLLALMVTGVVLTIICKKNAYQAKQAVGDSFLKSLALGFVLMVCVPIAIVILFATVIGIPIAIIAVFAYAILIYIAKIPVATFLGEKILRALGKQDKPSLVWSMLLGLVVLTLLLNIPYLEWPIYLAVIFTGFGAILNSQRRTTT